MILVAYDTVHPRYALEPHRRYVLYRSACVLVWSMENISHSCSSLVRQVSKRSRRSLGRDT